MAAAPGPGGGHGRGKRLVHRRWMTSAGSNVICAKYVVCVYVYM